MNYALIVIALLSLSIGLYYYLKNRSLIILEKILYAKSWKEAYQLADRNQKLIKKKRYDLFAFQQIKKKVSRTVMEYISTYKRDRDCKESIIPFLELLKSMATIVINTPQRESVTNFTVAIYEPIMILLMEDHVFPVIVDRASNEIRTESTDEKIEMIKRFFVQKSEMIVSLGKVFGAPWLDRQMLTIFDRLPNFNSSAEIYNKFTSTELSALRVALKHSPIYYNDREEDIVQKVSLYLFPEEMIAVH